MPFWSLHGSINGWRAACLPSPGLQFSQSPENGSDAKSSGNCQNSKTGEVFEAHCLYTPKKETNGWSSLLLESSLAKESQVHLEPGSFLDLKKASDSAFFGWNKSKKRCPNKNVCRKNLGFHWGLRFRWISPFKHHRKKKWITHHFKPQKKMSYTPEDEYGTNQNRTSKSPNWKGTSPSKTQNWKSPSFPLTLILELLIIHSRIEAGPTKRSPRIREELSFVEP